MIKIGILGILLNYSFFVSAQEIKVTDFRKDLKDISAREHPVYDANNDACAILKIRTGIQGTKFSGDLGIRKTEYHDGEFWLWVSPDSHQLTIEAEGIGKLDYMLPLSAEEYTVFVIFLSVILPDKYIYKDINTIKIETKPTKAEIYSDSTFFGYTPININTSSDTFNYVIKKNKYSTIMGSIPTREAQKAIYISLKKDPEINRLFLNAYFGYNSYSYASFGLQFGTVGKTGWYFSLVPPIMAKTSIGTVRDLNGTQNLQIDDEEFTSIIGESYESYDINIRESNSTFYNNFRIKGGITQKIFSNTFLSIGVGLAEYRLFYRLEVVPKLSDPLNEIPLDKHFYAKSNDLVGMFCFETGIIYRISNSYLINFNISTTGFAHYFTGIPGDYLLPLEGIIGFGYNF